VNKIDFKVGEKYKVRYTDRHSYSIKVYSTSLYECKIKEGNLWAIHASGNGYSFNHKIEFEAL